MRRDVCLVLVAFGFLISCASIKESQYKIKKGTFEASLNETGELDAVNSRIIIIPFIGWKYGGRMKITEMLEHGTQVTKGDSIAQIDISGVLKFLVEKESALEIEQANLNKLHADHKSRIKQLQAELASTKAALELAQVQVEKHQFESQSKQRIKALELERARVAYDKIVQKTKLTDIILKNELKIQELKLVRLQSDVDEANQALKQLTVHSPLDGMMQLLENRQTGQMLKVGDELYQGERFACVPDLRSMKVNTTVNESDIAKIALDQKVVVRLDAFPDKPFNGRIVEIGKLSYKKDEKSRAKVFDVVVHLDKSDQILKPGMTVRCDIQYAQLKDVLFVQNDCVLKKNGDYYLFLENKDGCKKCCVTIGPRNNQYTVIYGDVVAGQKVVPIEELDQQTILARL
jgi:multidrug efflux pump subunit AcrA (membrane-fusion protein)